MILHLEDGRLEHTPVWGATLGRRLVGVTLNASDLEALLRQDASQIKEFLGSAVLTRFGPYQAEADKAAQLKQVRLHNRKQDILARRDEG